MAAGRHFSATDLAASTGASKVTVIKYARALGLYDHRIETHYTDDRPRKTDRRWGRRWTHEEAERIIAAMRAGPSKSR